MYIYTVTFKKNTNKNALPYETEYHFRSLYTILCSPE